jgi:hypothetical protein
MGGFLGAYKVSNGIVYGFAGGVADPRIVPPRELGSFNLNSGQPNQTIQSGGVAPEPAAGRVFFVGSNFGNSNPTLLSFDANTYEMLSSQQLSGNGQPMDLLRWGRDGLAWHSSLSSPFGGTQGKGQVVLIRGPFVVPQWGTQNPTPGVTATSPNSANHGSGNLTLTVTGSNFVPGAVVLWNGNERTTTFVDTSHVSVAIPASDLAQAGTATVVVNNPGSSNSGSVSFTIQ